jgi:hypothetical protein
MKKLALLVGSLALLASSVAFAKPMGIMAMPSVRKQVLASAKQDSAWQGTRPSLRMTTSKSGKTITASIYTVSRFAGPPTPLPVPTRMLQATATFRVKQTSEGKLVTPIRHYGQVWSHVMRMLAK